MAEDLEAGRVPDSQPDICAVATPNSTRFELVELATLHVQGMKSLGLYNKMLFDSCEGLSARKL